MAGEEHPWHFRELQRRDASDLCRCAARLRAEAAMYRAQAVAERERAEEVREAAKLCRRAASRRVIRFREEDGAADPSVL